MELLITGFQRLSLTGSGASNVSNSNHYKWIFALCSDINSKEQHTIDLLTTCHQPTNICPYACKLENLIMASSWVQSPRGLGIRSIGGRREKESWLYIIPFEEL